MDKTNLCFTCHELAHHLDTMSKVGNLNFNKGGHQDTFFKIQRLRKEHIDRERKEEQRQRTAYIHYDMGRAKGLTQAPLRDLRDLDEQRLQQQRQQTLKQAKSIYTATNSATAAFNGKQKSTQSRVHFNTNKPMNSPSVRCCTDSFHSAPPTLSVRERFQKQSFRVDTAKDIPPDKPDFKKLEPPSFTPDKRTDKVRQRDR